MTPEIIFKACNTFALLAWILLIVLGCKRWVTSIITGAIVPLCLAVIYAALLLSHWGEATGSFNSLAGVTSLFSNPWILTAGWIHYLAFDLFIGSWEAQDAASHGISHCFVVPCLILTFLFGPIGLLLYFAIRTSLRRRSATARYVQVDSESHTGIRPAH